MAAGDPILDVSDLVNLCTGGGGGAPEQINFYKSGLRQGIAATAPIIGRITSLWMWDGTPGAASAAPTTAVVLTNADAGALKQTTSASGAKKRLLGITAAGLVAGTLILYDRLVQHGGMSGTVTTAQTTNLTGATTPALTRRTSGVGVEIWYEIYSAIGSTATTCTSTYTRAGGGSATTQAIAFGGTNALSADRILPVALASGDTGVTAVTNADIVASTLTAGNFGITMAYPLVSLPLPMPGVGAMFTSFLLPGGPLDLGATSDACLAFAWFPNTVTPPQVFGSAYFMEK
jgi:hypothetical protein